MSQYKVIIKEEAQADLKNLLRYEPKAYKKALRLIGELYDHPSQRNIDLFIAFSKLKSMLMFYLPMGIIMTNSLVHEIISITEEAEK